MNYTKRANIAYFSILLFIILYNNLAYTKPIKIYTVNKNQKRIIEKYDIDPISQRYQLDLDNLSENKFICSRNEDTLILDDGNEFLFPGDVYLTQRFSPGVLCTLKSVVLKPAMTGMPCTLFVWPDSSGIPQSSVNLVSPIYFMSSGPNWQRIDLPLPIVTDEDFWVGLYHTTKLYSDNTPNCHKRIAHSYDKIDWYVYNYHTFGELLIRPIVSLTGPRHDVSCIILFSKKGFFLPNPAFDTVGVVVKNFGSVTETDVPVYLRVRDTLGLLVFFNFIYIDSLQHNEIDTAFIAWNHNEDSDYIIEGYPFLPNDCVRDNDRLEIESYIRTYPCELYYDNIDSMMASSLRDSIANKFIPPYYPCQIESVKCHYIAPPAKSTYTYGIAAIILDDDGAAGFPGSEIAKDSILGLVGPNWFQWLIIDFSNHNVVFDSGGFFVEWTFIPDSTTLENPQIWTDWGTPPSAMMTWIEEDGTWYHWWERTDVVLRAFLNFPSAISEKDKRQTFSNYISIHPTISSGKFKCSFCAKKDGKLNISCYSVNGRRIKTLLKTYIKKGLHYIYPDLSNLPQGVYFIRMDGEGFTDKKKIILIK
ncbi:T9SS type A sorting domain-containing protein [candidate division WOR-3 bacterium]|nr:T9SS type A sorting domain-containing protein [candidate division WOR-3 bacterium]